MFLSMNVEGADEVRWWMLGRLGDMLDGGCSGC